MMRSFVFLGIAATLVLSSPPAEAQGQKKAPPKSPALTKRPPAATGAALIEALKAENAAQALNLVNRGADPNAMTEDRGMSALGFAAELGDLQLVQALLAHGAQINPTDPDTEKPLAAAMDIKSEPIAQLLVEKGADVNAGDGGEYERRPLLMAAEYGWLPLVTLLLDKGAEINHIADDSYTVLAAAAEGGHLPIVELLVARGAAIGTDPLVMQQAIISGSVPILEFLLAHGRTLAAEKPSQGMTLLHLAALSNSTTMLERILHDTNADLEAVDEDGETSLQLAASSHLIHAVTFLLEKKARVNALDNAYQSVLDVAMETRRGEDTSTPAVRDTITALRKAGAKPAPPSLWRAAIQRDKKQLQTLLDAGADPNEPDSHHAVPLYYVLVDHSFTGTEDLVKALLSKGANPNAKGPDGRPLIEVARDESLDEVIPLLRQAGAETPELDLTEAIARDDTPTINALLEKGVIPESDALVYAMARKDDHALLIRLLDKGAKVNTPVRLRSSLFTSSPDFPLHAAVQTGDVALTQLLLERGADPNVHKEHGPVPLHVVATPDGIDAAASDATVDAIVHLLVEHGAAVRGHDRSSIIEESILASLAGVASPKTLAYVMEKGAAVDINPPAGDTKLTPPLTIAVRMGRPEAVRLLLERGANPNAIDHIGRQTILMEAAQEKETPESLEVVRLLLEHGAQLDTRDTQGQNAMRLAEDAGHRQVAQLLQAAGSGKATIAPGAAISRAIYQGDVVTVLRLLKEGFDPNGTLPGGTTVLYDAAYQGNLSLIQLLLERGADVNKNSNQGTPLHGAADAGETEAVRLLLARGAKPDMDDGFIGTPLARAAQDGHLAILRLLLKAGADPNARHSEFPGAPLYNAVSKGGEEAMELLLKAGSDPSIGTPLFATLWLGNVGGMERLVRAGANVNAQNASGRTILMEAAALGDKASVIWLIAHKANVNLKDKKGKTALSEALDRDKRECAQILRKAGAQ